MFLFEFEKEKTWRVQNQNKNKRKSWVELLREVIFQDFQRKIVGNGEDFDFYFEKTLHTGVFTLQVLLDDYLKYF